MSLEKAVRAVLTSDSTVSSLVASRVYPMRRPQGSALPAIVYSNVFTEQNQSVATQSGIRRTRLSVDCISSTYGGVKTLRDAVESALVNYSGTGSGETIYSLRLESAVDLDQENIPGSQFGAFRVVMDFIAWHE